MLALVLRPPTPAQPARAHMCRDGRPRPPRRSRPAPGGPRGGRRPVARAGRVFSGRRPEGAAAGRTRLDISDPGVANPRGSGFIRPSGAWSRPVRAQKAGQGCRRAPGHAGPDAQLGGCPSRPRRLLGRRPAGGAPPRRPAPPPRRPGTRTGVTEHFAGCQPHSACPWLQTQAMLCCLTATHALSQGGCAARRGRKGHPRGSGGARQAGSCAGGGCCGEAAARKAGQRWGGQPGRCVPVGGAGRCRHRVGRPAAAGWAFWRPGSGLRPDQRVPAALACPNWSRWAGSAFSWLCRPWHDWSSGPPTTNLVRDKSMYM